MGDDNDPYRNGGLNPYRARYNVRRPLRFHSSAGNYYDEVNLYRQFRERPDMPPTEDGLKILLVGELAFNPERVLALEERGHKLYGLWMPNPGSMNTVGPLSFGHVEDVPREGWREAMERLRPDIIYALLNLHEHPIVLQDGWVSEFSKYDAGWLHLFESNNGGDVSRASWDDLKKYSLE